MSQIIKEQGECMRFQIKHNIVREVEKFNNDEEGITSAGEDSLGNSVYIKNLDAGKTKELMRVVLEGDYMELSSRRFIFIVLIIGTIISAIVLYFLFFSGKNDGETIKTNVVENIPLVGLPASNDVKFLEESEEIEQSEESEESEESETPKNNFENQFEIQSLKLENSRLSYSYEDLQKEYFSELEENKNLKNSNSDISSENNELRKKIAELEKNIAELEVKSIQNQNSPKNFNSNEFICYLGSEIYKKCEKAEGEGEKNACKDLYYNFIKE